MLSMTLCNPMNCSLLGSSVHGILQARILEWVAMPSPSRGSSQPREWTPALLGGFFTCPTWEAPPSPNWDQLLVGKKQRIKNKHDFSQFNIGTKTEIWINGREQRAQK